MYKLIDSSSFFSPEELQVMVVDTHNLGSLVKQAADYRISDFVRSLSPRSDKMYLHINAMGAGEYYGCNKNGDYFPEANLKEYYKTFETSPAHVFRHHINKDPAKSIGKVLFAIYNDRMHRVELISEVDTFLGQDIEDRIAAGDFPSTSMACKTPWDICSVCGNKAHTRQEYCSHLRNELGHTYTSGKRVMALNLGPLRFFDISIVIRPADVTSSVLQKVAFSRGEAMGSAEIAELEGLGETKQASFRKLADIIKEIEGGIDQVSPELDKILFKTKDLKESLVDSLRAFDLTDSLGVMAELGINPSVEFLAELISRKYLGEEGRGLGKLAASFMKLVDPARSEVPSVEFARPERINPLVYRILLPHAEECSLLPEHVEKRAMERGYASFNPNAIEEPKAVGNPQQIQSLEPLSKTLLTLGGAALLAKIFITNLIEEKIKEAIGHTRPKNNVKILIAKQASDLLSTVHLIKAALAKEVKRDQKKDLDNLASATTFVLKNSKTVAGDKLAKAIKILQVGSKNIEKHKD